MSYPTKPELIFITKDVLHNLIIKFSNRTIENKQCLYFTVIDALWESTLRTKISFNKFVVIQKFLSYFTQSEFYPLTESSLILKVTIALEFLYGHTIEEIYNKIPNSYPYTVTQ